MSMARYAGQNGARAIQKSRKRRGKPRAFPKIKAYSLGAATSQAVPVRINTNTTQTNAPRRIIRTERTTISVAPTASVTGTVGHFNIETNCSTLNALQVDSAQFSKSSVLLLEFIYEPIAGSGVNGQLDMGFQPNVEEATNASWSTGPVGINQMPVRTTGSVGMRKTLPVVISEETLSHGGKHLLSAISGAAVQPPNDWRYWGQFVWSASQCSVTTGTLPVNVGTFSVKYIVQLEGPKMDISSSTSAHVAIDAATGALSTVQTGRAMLETTDESLRLSTFRTVSMVACIPAGNAIDFELDGVAYDDSAIATTVGGSSVKWFDPRKFIAPSELTWVTTGTGTIHLFFVEGVNVNPLDLL